MRQSTARQSTAVRMVLHCASVRVTVQVSRGRTLVRVMGRFPWDFLSIRSAGAGCGVRLRQFTNCHSLLVCDNLCRSDDRPSQVAANVKNCNNHGDSDCVCHQIESSQCGSLVVLTQAHQLRFLETQKRRVPISCSMITTGHPSIMLARRFLAFADLGLSVASLTIACLGLFRTPSYTGRRCGQGQRVPVF